MIRIPLHDRAGQVRAFALVDDEDRELVAGKRWSLAKNGYAIWSTSRGGRSATFLLHRVITGLERGDPLEADHQNGDKLDCRRENLRLVTHAQNGQNITRRRGRSRFRNVSWHKARGRWQVKLRVAGRQHHGGYFDEELAAAVASNEMRRQLMPWALPDPELAKALAA